MKKEWAEPWADFCCLSFFDTGFVAKVVKSGECSQAQSRNQSQVVETNLGSVEAEGSDEE